MTTNLINKIKNPIWLVIVICLFQANCFTSLRSAKGLKQGEVQVNYIFPMVGNLRVGLTNNLEYRLQAIGEGFQTDLFFHHKAGAYHLGYDFGIAGSAGDEDDNMWYGLSMVASREYLEKINPYITAATNFSASSPPLNYIAIGCEAYLFKNDKSSFNISITPEIQIFPKTLDFDYFETPAWGTVLLGFTFDFPQILGAKK